MGVPSPVKEEDLRRSHKIGFSAHFKGIDPVDSFLEKMRVLFTRLESSEAFDDPASRHLVESAIQAIALQSAHPMAPLYLARSRYNQTVELVGKVGWAQLGYGFSQVNFSDLERAKNELGGLRRGLTVDEWYHMVCAYPLLLEQCFLSPQVSDPASAKYQQYRFPPFKAIAHHHAKSHVLTSTEKDPSMRDKLLPYARLCSEEKTGNSREVNLLYVLYYAMFSFYLKPTPELMHPAKASLDFFVSVFDDPASLRFSPSVIHPAQLEVFQAIYLLTFREEVGRMECWDVEGKRTFFARTTVDARSAGLKNHPQLRGPMRAVRKVSLATVMEQNLFALDAEVQRLCFSLQTFHFIVNTRQKESLIKTRITYLMHNVRSVPSDSRKLLVNALPLYDGSEQVRVQILLMAVLLIDKPERYQEQVFFALERLFENMQLVTKDIKTFIFSLAKLNEHFEDSECPGRYNVALYAFVQKFRTLLESFESSFVGEERRLALFEKLEKLSEDSKTSVLGITRGIGIEVTEADLAFVEVLSHGNRRDKKLLELEEPYGKGSLPEFLYKQLKELEVSSDDPASPSGDGEYLCVADPSGEIIALDVKVEPQSVPPKQVASEVVAGLGGNAPSTDPRHGGVLAGRRRYDEAELSSNRYSLHGAPGLPLSPDAGGRKRSKKDGGGARRDLGSSFGGV
jgi:hypothetical protein